MEDHKILELLRKGEHASALDFLYEAYPAVRQLIITNSGNEDDVKDIFQEALIIFYQKAISQDFQLTSKISTYLYSTCRFIWKDKLKSNNHFLVKENIEDIVEINHEENEELDENRMLASVLMQLGDKCQSILESYYLLKMSMQEIANQFQYGSVESAKNQKYKCLERAKKLAKVELNNLSKIA